MKALATIVAVGRVGRAARRIMRHLPVEKLVARAPTWTGPMTNEIAAHGSWFRDGAPERFFGHGWAFEVTFEYPFPGAYYADKLTFIFALPNGQPRGVVFRISGGSDDCEEKKRTYILYEVLHYVARTYEPQVRAVLAAKRAREQAKRDLESFTARFKASVEADTRRVAAEFAAGRDAKLRDWLNEMKPPAAVLDALKRVVSSAEKEVEAARQQAEYERQMAIREAEWAIERAREEARKERLAGKIDLAGDAGLTGITFGTPVEEGDDLVIPVDKIQHMLVGGIPGSGKTVFLHSLIVQFLRSPDVEQLILIDLKGTEFVIYDDQPKAQVYTHIDSVAASLDEVLELLAVRKASLAQQKRRTWSGPRAFVVIDEHAMLNAHLAETKAAGQKVLATRLANSLRQIVLTARSLGVVLICALQKPTADAIDSNVKANMGFRCCFALKTRQAIEAVLDYTDELPIDPRHMRTGRFLFDDGRNGITRMQAHVPPELDLSGGW